MKNKNILRGLVLTTAMAFTAPALADHGGGHDSSLDARLYQEYNGWREQCQNYHPAPEGFTREGCRLVAVKKEEPPPAPVVEVAPPPPPEPQRVEEAKSYTVYFPVGKATLDESARNLVMQAAGEIRGISDVQVKVSGYTSTSSSSGYNDKLSQRRAAAVVNALSELGVPATAVAAEAHGETGLAVPTPDKTEMPANRRAVIEYKGWKMVTPSSP